MKLVSYQSASGPRVAGLRDGALVDLNRADPTLPSCIKKLLALGPDVFSRAARAIANGMPLPAETVQLPPIPRPEKIICVGLNYADHARETGMPAPPEPVLFNKFPTAAAAHGQPIVLPPESREVDYEAELVAVIGRGGRHIAAGTPWSTWPPTAAATMFRPATGSFASRADSGCWANRSTRSPRSAPNW